MNPDANKLEPLFEAEMERQKDELERRMKQYAESPREQPIAEKGQLVRADGSPVPDHWPIFKVDERLVVKNYTFRVAYINETTLVLEPTGPLLVGAKED